MIKITINLKPNKLCFSFHQRFANHSCKYLSNLPFLLPQSESIRFLINLSMKLLRWAWSRWFTMFFTIPLSQQRVYCSLKSIPKNKQRSAAPARVHQGGQDVTPDCGVSWPLYLNIVFCRSPHCEEINTLLALNIKISLILEVMNAPPASLFRFSDWKLSTISWTFWFYFPGCLGI